MDQAGLTHTKNKSKGYQTLLVAAILLVAVNLRPAITSVGPLIGTIRDDIGLSNWNVALLTSLPLIAFMLISPIAPKIANKLTSERALLLGLFILVIGIILRSISLMFFLFFGTFLVGFGIAICNVLLPSIIKDKFPFKVAIMTSLYTTIMTLFATIASGVSIPLADGVKLGWEISLVVWVIPVIIGLVFWFIIVTKNKPKSNHQIVSDKQNVSNNRIWQEPLAWYVAMFMGLQSFIFYVIVSWLPEILQFYGVGKTGSGFMLSYYQLIGVPVSFVMPIIAIKMKKQRLIILIVNALFITGLLLLLINKSLAAIIIATTLLGIGGSSNFALALTFFSIRAKNAKDAVELSGMAQSVGYCIAAIGPILLGFLFDITQDWKYPLFVLIGVMITIILVGMQAGKDRYVFE